MQLLFAQWLSLFFLYVEMTMGKYYEELDFVSKLQP